jgi:hypothetical protein
MISHRPIVEEGQLGHGALRLELLLLVVRFVLVLELWHVFREGVNAEQVRMREVGGDELIDVLRTRHNGHLRQSTAEIEEREKHHTNSRVFERIAIVCKLVPLLLRSWSSWLSSWHSRFSSPRCNARKGSKAKWTNPRWPRPGLWPGREPEPACTMAPSACGKDAERARKRGNSNRRSS